MIDQPDITIGVQAHSAPAAQPSPPNAERYLCPIGACTWTHDAELAPVVNPQVLAQVFGPGVMALAAANGRRTKIERALEEHFNTHALAEYIAEISSLRNLNVGLARQIYELTKAYEAATAALRETVPAPARQRGSLGAISGL